jgi:hypothetical protein
VRDGGEGFRVTYHTFPTLSPMPSPHTTHTFTRSSHPPESPGANGIGSPRTAGGAASALSAPWRSLVEAGRSAFDKQSEDTEDEVHIVTAGAHYALLFALDIYIAIVIAALVVLHVLSHTPSSTHHLFSLTPLVTHTRPPLPHPLFSCKATAS